MCFYVVLSQNAFNLEGVKEQMQLVLRKNAEALYQSMAPQLIADITGMDAVDVSLDVFIEAIDDTGSKLYDFVQVN